jgi:hypothetical protein
MHQSRRRATSRLPANACFHERQADSQRVSMITLAGQAFEHERRLVPHRQQDGIACARFVPNPRTWYHNDR